MRYKLSKRYIVANKFLRRAYIFSFSSLSLLFFLTLSPLSFTPEYTEATSPDSDVVMSLSFSSQTASASIDTVSHSGTFASSSSNDEKIGFTIATNNFTGYTLTLSSTGNGELSNGSNSTLDPITSSVSQTTFSATNNTTYNNKWGYLPNIYNSAANTNYQAPPVSGQDPVVLNVTNSANSPDGIGSPDTYSIGLGIRADYNSASGTYTNDTFILQYVANPAIYTITYDENKKNTSDTVENLPATQEGTVGDNDIILGSEVPGRIDDNNVTDYTFIGWCSVATTDTNNDGTDECSGTIYNPNGNGTNLSYSLSNISSLNSNEITLYAMWEPAVLYDAINITCGTGVNSVSIHSDYYDSIDNACNNNGLNELRYGVSYTITATIDEENYDFASWEVGPGSVGSNITLGSTTDNPTTMILTDKMQELTVNTTANQKLTIKAGNNIETVIIADAGDNYKPYYATAEDPVILENQAANHKYLITVVPEANNILDSWDRSSSSGNLASSTLLTTTYTTGSSGETLTASGVGGSYSDNMQNLAVYMDSKCPANGINVTDVRNNKSYTIAKIGDYCYMLSNLRLDNIDSNNNPVALNSTSSDVSSSFTMPTLALDDTYYSAAAMQIYNHEYYYNWYAAKANSHVDANPTTSGTATVANDNESLGSICPAGWTLPDYAGSITSYDLWYNGSNPGFLTATGSLQLGQQTNFGTEGLWWSSIIEDIGDYTGGEVCLWDDDDCEEDAQDEPAYDYAYSLRINNSTATGATNSKYVGMPIRCTANTTDYIFEEPGEHQSMDGWEPFL